jgi:ATP/maltotriose-dependent transcriptional regulator MalT/DNA-binding SARP family transcriptional activator
MGFAASNKFVAPTLPSALLHRVSLVTRLRDIIATDPEAKESITHYKLFLLCAPAGYGKTTLLADFAQSTALPCCWYFLDRNDTDRYIFLYNLLSSIRHRFPGFGAALDASLPTLAEGISTISLEGEGNPFEVFIDALVAALDTEITQRFAILLCNYHEVDESQAITSLINYLIQKMPSHGILIIESRAAPSIEFASLLAHRQALGWGSNMLRMTAQEILELAHVQGVAPLTQNEAKQLALAFDGWITGILLGTRLGDTGLLHAGTRTGVLQGLPSMRVERQKLFIYLVNEIFSHQPAIYAFLREAAILERMVPTLCDQLLDITGSAEHLEYLARQGMFVSCSDEGAQPIYTCHPILRELLCDELHRESPERFTELHRRAARLLGASHEYDKAISHSLAAGDSSIAAQMIIRAYEQASPRDTEALLLWIEALPSETVESNPQLLLIRTDINLLRGEYTQAQSLLDTTDALLTRAPATVDPNDTPRLQAEIMILRSKALFQAGKYQEAQSLCQRVLETTPMDEVSIRAEAHARFGICADVLGDLTAGIEHLQKALHLWGRNTIRRQTAEAHSALASSYNLLGNFALAEHHISRAISCCDQLHDDRGKINNLIRMGVYKQRQGAFSDAEAALLQALAIAREGSPIFEREEAYILVNLGSIFQDEGHYDQSLESLENGLDVARRLRDNYLVNCSLCYLAMTYLLMGDASTARLLISETNLPPLNANNVGYERAIHDLTYGTILLYQNRYDDAFTCFTALEASLKNTGLKRELLQVKLRLAACQLARMERTDAASRLQEVTSFLERQESYERLISVGLNRFPELYQFVKTLPGLERLRILLHIAPTAQETRKGATLAQVTSAPYATGAHPTRLKIQAFGEPSVFLDERPITRWRMARAMELFFFLLDCGRPMRKEQIITALWPQVDDQINQTFHSTIYYLRKALNDSFITSHGGLYSLDLSSLGADDLEYDVALFKEHYARAKQFLASENDTEARVELLAMMDLYRGDYVQPFYGDWCSFSRDELRRIYLEARSHLAHIAWRQGEFDESATHWQHMLAMDNWIEEAHYGLIRYYMRTGKRALALRQYHRCVDTLQQELGVRPGPALQNLYQRLTSSSSGEPVKKSERTTPLSEGASRSR